MLAKPYSRMRFGGLVFIQAKLDGVRCYITKDGAFTRTHKELKNVEHIKQELEPLFKMYPLLILDGELYNHELRDDFEKIISLTRKLKPTRRAKLEAKNMIQFHWYDVYTDKKNLNYAKRYKAIEVLYELFKDNFNAVKFVPSEIVKDEETAYKKHAEFLAQGYEGSILRADKRYETKRSSNLQKIKDFEDAEATITGLEEGEGKLTGHVGNFVMKDDEGIVFRASFSKGFNFTVRKRMWETQDCIGKRATFEFFGRTGHNSYRHPKVKAVRDYE